MDARGVNSTPGSRFLVAQARLAVVGHREDHDERDRQPDADDKQPRPEASRAAPGHFAVGSGPPAGPGPARAWLNLGQCALANLLCE